MKSEKIEFQQETLAARMKISKRIIGDIDLTLGYVEDDYVQGMLTAELTGYIYTNMAEERDLDFYCPPPTFKDWLLKKRRMVTFHLKVKDLLLNPPKGKDTARIYVTELINTDE